MTNKIDLHIHTTSSDGTKTPTEVLQEAESLGLETIAITDHESVGAYPEIIANRKFFSGNMIPGIELKTICNKRKIELLGYGIDIAKMRALLPEYYQEKTQLNYEYLKAIIATLRQKGIKISEDLPKYYVDRMVQPATFVTNALKDDKENYSYNHECLLDDTFLHQGKSGLYREWFSNPESRFFVDFEFYPKYAEVMQLIKDCDGLVFIPHIYQYAKMSDSILQKLLESNVIDGIECFYPTFSPEQSTYLENLAKEKGLFISGGSDYHGANKKNLLGRGFPDNLYIDEEYIKPWTEEILAKEEPGLRLTRKI